jgi:hypothetical protein
VREGLKLKVLENRGPSRIFGPKREDVMENGENCMMRSFINFTCLQILLKCSDFIRISGAGSTCERD